MLNKFTATFSVGQMLVNEPMKNHTSFKTGGNVDLMLLPVDVKQISQAIRICTDENISFFIMGNGSNLLVKDKGYRGVIIKTTCLNKIEAIGDIIYAQSGALLFDIANIALANSLSGFAFASGIPGTLGGAVFMNAGAYEGEIKHVLIDAEVIDHAGNIYTLTNDELAFGYRKSEVQNKNLIVLSARLQLKHGILEKIEAEMTELGNRRSDKQPLEMPSAGSTFKRPEKNYASLLIQESGLRGFSVGDAQVSNKHCGFIVNKGNASSQDILELIQHVQNVVYRNSEVTLEPEVRIIGE